MYDYRLATMSPAIFLDALPLFFVMMIHHQSFKEEIAEHDSRDLLVYSPNSSSGGLSLSDCAETSDEDEKFNPDIEHV